MDALTGLLDGPRARGAFLLRSLLDPPWSLRIRDGSPLSLITLLRGDAWIIKADAAPTRIQPGDVAVVNGTDAYTIADQPDTQPQIVIHPGQRCESVDGTEMALAADLLRQEDATIAAVARRVGYGSAFALSAAFKRERGVSPQEYRRRPAEGVVPQPYSADRRRDDVVWLTVAAHG
jgi:hypothetical protein